MTVLDTVNDGEDDFVTLPPQIRAGHKFVDPEFDEQTALGKYASYTGWMRPEVRLNSHHIYPILSPTFFYCLHYLSPILPLHLDLSLL